MPLVPKIPRRIADRRAVATTLISVICLLTSSVNAAFTEFYCQTTGSNLNAGSTNTDAATFTYTSAILTGGWDATTGIFTVLTGNPSSDGVTAGMFGSVYVTTGASVATFVARVTGASSSTVTVSLTGKSGTPPATDALGLTTLKVGGAWRGPNGATAFPFNFAAATMTNAASDVPRVNLKTGSNYAITAAMTHSIAGPIKFQGYTTTLGDGGKAIIDGGTTGASYILLTQSGTYAELQDLILQNNGATGAANALTIATAGNNTVLRRIVVKSVRGFGLEFSGVRGYLIEVEAYDCNQSNTASFAGIRISPAAATIFLLRCISHDNTGSNSSGFRMDATSSGVQIYSNCIAESNGAHGFNATNTATNSVLINCDAYNNTGTGLRASGATGTFSLALQNSNFIKNGAYGIDLSGGGVRFGTIYNCGFGAGTQANTTADTNGLGSTEIFGSVTYASGVTPWADPANGDFRINLAAAKGAGRGAFTTSAPGYGPTNGFPDIGAAQHQETGGGRRPQVRP